MLLPTNLLILLEPNIYNWLRNFLMAVIVKPTLITPAPLPALKSEALNGALKCKLYG